MKKKTTVAARGKRRAPLFIRLLSLLWNKAPRHQYYLEIGTHYLKKGTGYEVGQIIDIRETHSGNYRGKVITNLFYDFKENRVNHLAENKILTAKELVFEKRG